MPAAKPTPPPATPAPIPFRPSPPMAPPAPIMAPPSSTPIEAAPAVAPAATGSKAIVASLSELSERWPEPLKAEVRQMGEAQVSIPVALLEQPLRKGRVVMSWQNIRAFATPRPSGASANDGVELELPLKVIVPLFLEIVPPIRPPLRVSV